MSSARPLFRAGLARPFRAQRFRTPLQRRFQSTTNENARSFHPAAVGGVAGSVTAFATCYIWYQFSGTKTLVKGAQDTKKYLDQVQAKFQEAAPDPNEALKWLRQTASTYAGFVPGASGVVNTAFDELDSIHDSHRDEVDKIIHDAYNELKELSKKGLNVDSAKQGWEIILKHLRRAHSLAGDVMNEVLDRHPEVKEKVGAPIQQLRQMGDQLGPEAKDIVDQAWKQASEIVNNNEGGVLSPANIGRVQKIVDEATEKLRKYGDEAWYSAMDQAKPYLDKAPEVKKIVEENASHLKQGNAKELIEKVQNAVKTGNSEELQDYVKRAARKAQSSGMGSLQQYLDKIPGGDQILPNLSKLQEVAHKHGKEAESLFKSTIDELSQVLNKKAEEAKEIAQKAEKDAGGSGDKTRSWLGKK